MFRTHHETAVPRFAPRMWAALLRPQSRLASGLRAFALEHALPLLLFAVLGVGVSYPLVTHFTTHILGGGGVDPHHNLWILWHTRQAVLGEQPWFFAPLLYYPLGASLLTHGLGPVTGFFALPFWPWGPEAAHNGAVLVSLALTGYGMYLLARGLGMARSLALFAGLLLLLAPITLTGLHGHMTKVFLGGMPLALLALHHTLSPQRSAWWALATALALLLLLLHSGYQFVFAGLGLAFFWLYYAWNAPRADYRWLLGRTALLAGWGALLLGPLLWATLRVAQDPALRIDANDMSLDYHLDATLFFLPPYFSALLGFLTEPLFELYAIRSRIDSAVSLSWVGLLLCGAALWRNRRAAWPWLLCTLGCLVLALGPFVQLFGRTLFTEYELPIVLPYAFLMGLPGLDFIRLASRFMMLGTVTFVVVALYGLAGLTRGRARWQRYLLVGLASGLLLLEAWPRPWPLEQLPPVPQFYRDLAHDNEHYGVFDLPLSPGQHAPTAYVQPSANFQIFQMTHQKGIAAGYLSRTYAQHPLFPGIMAARSDSIGAQQPDFLVGGEPSGPYVNLQYDLARYNYRYVVWHKQLHPDTPGAEMAQTLLDAVFGSQKPLVDDDLVRVYAVREQPPRTTLEQGDNWSRFEGEWRWAASPATVVINAVRAQQAWLEITPAALYDPAAPNRLGAWAMLDIHTTDGRFATSVELIANQTTRVPIPLVEGRQELVLASQSGNFRPADYGVDDERLLSFAIRSINIVTAGGD